jgi:hypothetical protein
MPAQLAGDLPDTDPLGLEQRHHLALEREVAAGDRKVTNVGVPPRLRNHLVPAACDTPTAAAASSLDEPLAISRHNSRSTSWRSEGFPGDFIDRRSR